MPCLRRRYGWTALPWIGPGRMIATSTTRSSRLCGRDLGSVCIWARLSTWNTPTVSAAWSISKTSGISSGMWSRSRQTAQSCSMSWTHSSMAASMPRPSRSSLISFIVSTSRLSNWTTTRSVIVARSMGAMSMSGAAVTSMPPEWIDRWRGKPSMRAHSSSQRSQSERPATEPRCGCSSGGRSSACGGILMIELLRSARIATCSRAQRRAAALSSPGPPPSSISMPPGRSIGRSSALGPPMGRS